MRLRIRLSVNPLRRRDIKAEKALMAKIDGLLRDIETLKDRRDITGPGHIRIVARGLQMTRPDGTTALHINRQH